jgi:hypothetical protein
LHTALQEQNIESKILLNPFFSIGYLDQIEEDFLQSSIFLQIEPQSSDDNWLIAEYAADQELYSLCWVKEKYTYTEYFDAEMPAELLANDARMFSYLEHIAETHDLEDLISLIQNQLTLPALSI